MSLVCDYQSLGLRPASYRGAGFYVNSDTTTVGRRIVTHEYPKGDTPFHEDMGKKFTTYKVDAYISAAEGEMLKDALLDACTTSGAAMLILPQSMPVMAVCISASASRSLDKLGWFKIDMEFREAPAGAAGLTGVLSFAASIATVFTTLTAAASAVFVADFSTSLQTVNVVADAVTRVADVGAALIQAIETAPVEDSDYSAAAMRAATALIANCDYYASPDPSTGSGIPGTVAINSGYGTGIVVTGTGRAETIPAISNCVSLLASSLAPEDAQQVFRSLKDFVSTAPPIDSPQAPSDIVNNTNEDRLVGAFRRMALTQWAGAVAAQSYATRADAIQARADVAEAFYNAILTSDYSSAIVEALQAARDAAVQALSTQIINLPPTLVITTLQAMPALYWSYRVQGDLAQAEQISERNGAIDWMNIGGDIYVQGT